MNENDTDAIKLSSLEAQVMRHLRQMDQRARGEMLKISGPFADAHPSAPPPRLLRLVHSNG